MIRESRCAAGPVRPTAVWITRNAHGIVILSRPVLDCGRSAAADFDSAPTIASGIQGTKPRPLAPAPVPCPTPFGGASPQPRRAYSAAGAMNPAARRGAAADQPTRKETP